MLIEPSLEFQLLYYMADMTPHSDMSTILLTDILKRFLKDGTFVQPFAKGEGRITMGIHWSKLADRLARDGRHDDAIVVYTALVKESPDNAYFSTGLANLFIVKGDYEGAIAVCRAEVGRHPENFWLWYLTCRMYVRLNRTKDAIEWCEEEFLKSQCLSSALVLLNLYAREGRFYHAIQLYEQLLDNEDPVAFHRTLWNAIGSHTIEVLYPDIAEQVMRESYTQFEKLYFR